MKKILFYSAVILALVLAGAGCRSAPEAPEAGGTAAIPSAPLPSAHNVLDAPRRSSIIDWQNRTLGEEPRPGWVQAQFVNNDHDLVRRAFDLPANAVLRGGTATRTNREQARVVADLSFANYIARELREEIITQAGGNLTGGSVSQIIATEARVVITGGRRVASFWQLEEIEERGVRTRQYQFWSLYAFEPHIWQQLVARYVFEVIGELPTYAQQVIRNSFDEIHRQTLRQEALSDAEAQHLAEMRYRELENQRLREQELIRAGVSHSVAKARIAEARAEAIQAAVISGDRTTARILSVNEADTDWVAALRNM